MQVEGGAGDQNVKLEAEHAGRLPFLDAVDRGIAAVCGIDDRDAAAPLDLDRLVGADQGRGVLVQPDADREE
jgi:hypothetical protein